MNPRPTYIFVQAVPLPNITRRRHAEALVIAKGELSRLRKMKQNPNTIAHPARFASRSAVMMAVMEYARGNSTPGVFQYDRQKKY